MSSKNWEDIPNFQERVILLDKNAWRGPCVFYGLFEWKKRAGHVQCKICFPLYITVYIDREVNSEPKTGAPNRSFR